MKEAGIRFTAREQNKTQNDKIGYVSKANNNKQSQNILIVCVDARRR